MAVCHQTKDKTLQAAAEIMTRWLYTRGTVAAK